VTSSLRTQAVYSQATALQHNLSGRRRRPSATGQPADNDHDFPDAYRNGGSGIVDQDDHSDVDAYLAKEAQRKQTAPVQSIDAFIKHSHRTSSNNSNNMGANKKQHQQHVPDDEELSVLTMDPTLQAISRREAEGLITYPNPSHQQQKKKHLSAMEEEEEEDNYDHDGADDLSEIAPLDLVSL
jgi:hypothetical protein